MHGLFQLRGPEDLRGKLRRDLQRLVGNPLNVDAAFDFFVTAEHMLDWVYPKNVNRLKRKAERGNSILLSICSHIANGAKHFETEDRHHDSVSSAEPPSGYTPAMYSPHPYTPGDYVGAGRLVVKLQGKAMQAFGPSIEVLALARKVMEYWEKHGLV